MAHRGTPIPLRSSTPSGFDQSFEDTIRRAESLLQSQDQHREQERAIQNLTFSIQNLNSQLEVQDGKSFSGIRNLRFTGEGDPISFLDKFELFTAFQKKNARQKAAMLPIYFEGVALTWYKELPEEIKKDYEDLKDAFLNRFNSPDLKWVREQKVLERSQGPQESVDQYLNDMNTLCSTLEKEPNERMSLTLKGLRPEIKKFVITNRPKSLSELESWARLAYQLGIGATDSASELLLQETRGLREEINELKASRSAYLQSCGSWGRETGTVDGQMICSQRKGRPI